MPHDHLERLAIDAWVLAWTGARAWGAVAAVTSCLLVAATEG